MNPGMLRQLAANPECGRVALQASVQKGDDASARILLQQGIPARVASASEPNSGITHKQRLEAAPYTIQAVLAGSVETLHVLLEHGALLTDRGHASTLERGSGKRRVASLVTDALGACAWTLRLELLGIVAELLQESSGSALNSLAEVCAVPTDSEKGVRASSSSSRLQDFSWAHGATALVLALQSAGRSTGGAGDNDAESATRLLVERRADPNIANSCRDAPLHIAVRFGLASTTAALLQLRADPNLRDGQGDTALDVAARAGRTACVAHLREVLPSKSITPDATVTALEQEEDAERIRQDRKGEQRREKRNRQKERQRSQRDSEVPAAGIVAVSAFGNNDDDDIEATRARIAELRREHARTASKVRELVQTREADSARAERAEALLTQVQQQVIQWESSVRDLEPLVQAAEVAELQARQAAQEADEIHETIEAAMEREQAEHQVAVAKLRAELSEISHPSGKGPPEASSYEAEKELRFAAEARMLELEAALRAVSSELQPVANGYENPSVFAHNAVQHRLCEQQRQHAAEMRDLVAALSQQIQDKDTELEKELDAFFGTGLVHLIEALRREGLISGASKTLSKDPDRAARLRANLSPQLLQ